MAEQSVGTLFDSILFCSCSALLSRRLRNVHGFKARVSWDMPFVCYHETESLRTIRLSSSLRGTLVDKIVGWSTNMLALIWILLDSSERVPL